jgi:hypothetical protein
LFLENPLVLYWRFEVVYSFISQISSSALNFVINQPPINGSCSINPLNGTINTLFTITCSNWVDNDGIKDYSLYGYTTDISSKEIIAFSFLSNFQVRLPAGTDQTFLLNLVIDIRDTLDCITEFNLSTVIVNSDSAVIDEFITTFQSSTNNPIVQLLSSGNQNTVGQIISSLSKQFNQVNTNNLKNAISSKYHILFLFL